MRRGTRGKGAIVAFMCSRSPGSHRILPQCGVIQNLDLQLGYPASNAQAGKFELCDMENCVTAETLSVLICKMELEGVPPSSCGGCTK